MLETDIGYRLAHHEDLTWRPATAATDVTEGPIFEEGDVRVTAGPTDHAPVHPTVGYRVEDGGRSVVIAGDTVPCVGLDRLCAGADALVHTVVRRDQIEAIGLPACWTSSTTTPRCRTPPPRRRGPGWAPSS